MTIGETAPGMDVPAMIINDRTMVPLRYVSEMLGCEVVWNPDTRSINITK
ncbi:MAG: copper amine oxidase N-terminal domain-containing protein [Peptococcaceae bacterium]|nr:copper amine oxidase N-terminal domain-containing protein [Peptococcaceae bacterium]